MKKLALTILTACLSFISYAQTDTAFWFAAPDVSSFMNDDRPIFFRITSYQQPCNITISQPAGGGLVTQTFSMAANTTQSVDLTTWINSIECGPGNVIQNKGIKITSDNPVAVYYEANANGPNPELFALKGRNALGNEFYISSQNILNNSNLYTPVPFSSFNIVASQDNTNITITPTKNIVGHLANIPFAITLNKGQTYAAIATSQVAAQHLDGSYVNSTKPIAITLGDDLLDGGPVFGGFCQDLAGDQTVPANITGTEYIAIKSSLSSPFDKVFITATQNATSVSQDGVFVTNLNAGQSTQLTISNASSYIQTSAPSYAYQLSGVGCEVGSAVLPKITCTGSSSVSIARSTVEAFTLSLLVKNGGQGNFLVNNLAGVITAAQFAVVPSTGGLWYFAKVALPLASYPNGSIIRVTNSSNIFQLGVLQGGTASGTAFGYFSDFNSLQAHASAAVTTLCVGSNVQLNADFIPSATYGWTGPNGFTSALQNPVINNATLLNSGVYHLTVTVPGCGVYLDSVTVTVSACPVLNCNNWLSTPAQPAYVTVGDLDIAGNQVTIEALANMTAIGWDIVSKHSGPPDVNYLLRPTGAELTTSTGYVSTPAVCAVELNKTYHYAMVYDGATLKFYRNGFLMSQVAKTGTMVQNNLNTTIGWLSNHNLNENFFGYINEVRIWNVARTQAQIQAYMNTSLPTPAAQPGLLAYYTFDDLLNKQGNATWNGTIGGVASINATNPNCTFIADSCKTPSVIGGIINDYTPVLGLDPCKNLLTVEDGTKFNTGDTVLLIQMKGAVIDSSNTNAFGTITNYNNSGNYEFNYVKSKAGNVIELKNKLNRQYDIPTGKVQLIRVPYYNSVVITSPLTCLPWDGSKGGVLVLNAKDTISLQSDVDVSGKGFRGGIDLIGVNTSFNCYENQFYYSDNQPELASGKGEGIADISSARSFGKGALANGGGGGNSHNSGGAGGGNITAGGMGGYQFDGAPCNVTVPFDNRGVSGKSIPLSNANNKIFLGGGGGAGHSNDPVGGFLAKGGNGSGIAIILADKIISNTKKIIANGNAAVSCGLTTGACHEGMGGGGAAGTILMQVNAYVDNANVETKGGKGGDMTAVGFGRVGPGGGGSGGTLWLKNAALPANVTVSNTAGTNGVCPGYGNDPWGATAGTAGSNLFNLVVPVDNVVFAPNIDSVRIKDSLITCLNYDFKGFAYTNTNPINTWQWYFGDGGTDNIQNTSHTYLPGTYTVKLVVTDINGCKDSITKTIIASPCSGISNIINSYTPVLAFDPCKNMLTVEDASAFNTGDTVMIIQMKGATIDSTNTATFGTITNYGNAGNYEFNYVKSKTGNIIELTNILNRQYSIPSGKVQLIRVPYYQSALITATLTCLPWDGNKGGVLVLNVRDTVEMNADINTTGKGFLKGTMHNSNINVATCDVTNYYHPDNTVDAAGKGEGIAFLSSNRNSGKGPAANGGGGGMNTNSGGGGGSNGNIGGRGGNEWNNGCPNYLTISNWGYPGKSLSYNNAANKIFMGGAGGAGHCNNQFDDPTVNADYNGGNGGALIIINADYIKNNSKKIISKGDSAYQPPFSSTYVTHDGMGAGGAGGTVLVNSNNYINNLLIDVSGGKGADMIASVAAPGKVGPGGGGGGGVVWVKQNTLPAAVVVTNTGGSNGVITQGGNDPYGATPGLNGINVFSLVVPFDNIAFRKNIDSVRIKDSLTTCSSFDFKALSYINFNPINTWQWYFGDGGTANTQNTSHTYGSTGTFTVKLIVTDINGCKDSITKNVNTSGFITDAGLDTSICSNTAVSVTLHGNPGATTYAWTPAAYLNDPTLQNPIATISSTTRFYLNATSSFGCGDMDSVTITINPVPIVKTLIDTATCKGTGIVLTTTGIASTWHWSPGIYLNDSTISNPTYIDTASHTLYVTGTNVYGCAGKDTINVTVKALPIVRTIKDTTICSPQTVTLFTTGAQTYSWSPINNLSDPNIANPVFSGNLGHTYYVTGTAANGCKAKDTVKVSVNVPGTLIQPPGKSMCIAGRVFLDGANGNTVTYLWSPATYLSDTTSINPIAFPPATTYFQVLITDKVCNYDSTFSVHVIVNTPPLISAGKSNDIDCAFKSANLFASGGVRYLWTPSIGLSNDTIPNPIATPPKDQRYIVTVTDAAGCSVKDTVIVYNNPASGLARYMPNAFAPNSNSAANRCYGLLKWLHVEQLVFIIYDRWGEMMFSSGDPGACWDGTYKGKLADQGTYVYYIKAKTACGTEEQKGTFILIR